MKNGLLVALAVSVGLTTHAHAQSYPSRPITLIVPFPAGGAPDVLARILAERLRPSLGQPVIIENIAGASGSLGTARVARAEPNGHTLGWGTLSTHVVNGAALKLQYDVQSDFEAVAPVTKQPLMIVGRRSLPANDLRALLAWLKANPGKGTLGVGGLATRLAGVLFQRETGTRLEFVPYRGSVLALQGLMSGQVDMTIDLASNSLPQVSAATIRAYAVAAKTRLTAAPDIPTVDEAGLPGFYVSTWHAIFAPKGTPRPIIDKLSAAIATILADPEVRVRLIGLGQEPFPGEQQAPQALAAYQKSEIERWWPIIKTAGIKAK